MSYPEYTTAKENVKVPAWAKQFEEGDVVEWETNGVSGESEILGFSENWQGLPVIEAPHDKIDGPEGVETVALEAKNIPNLGIEVDVDTNKLDEYVDLGEVIGQ